MTGGAIFEFYHDESLQADTRVEAFGFNLMGVEDAKRDVVIDIFIADTSDQNRDEVEISVIREFVQGSQTQGGVQYISYAIPSGPEFENKVLVGFSIIEPGNVSGTDDRDIYSVDDLVLAVNNGSSFGGLVAPQTLLDGVLPSGGGQSGGTDGQGAMPSEAAPGPFWVDDEDRLVLTNIGSTSSFQPNLQVVAADLETLELYDREMLQKLKDTKGHIVLEFENTSTSAPASVAISADIIAEMGRSISSGASASLIEVDSTSTTVAVSLIGSSGDWKKESLFGSDYEQMAKRLDSDNTYTLYVNKNDGNEVGVLIDSDTLVTLERKSKSSSIHGGFILWIFW